jgi:aspartate kinase
VSEKNSALKGCLAELEEVFNASARMQLRKVAIVGVIGSNMKIPGFLAKAATALSNANINVLALDQCMRQVNMQFIIDRADFEVAQKALHKELVELQ